MPEQRDEWSGREAREEWGGIRGRGGRSVLLEVSNFLKKIQNKMWQLWQR